MAEYENQILSFTATNSKPGAWLKLKTVNDKGEAKDAMLTKADLIAMVKSSGPGFYGITKTKEGEYWTITQLRFIRPLGGEATPAAAPAAGAPATQAAPRTPGSVDANVLLQNKAITAQVAMKATAELLGHALNNGAFKIEGGIVDTDGLIATAKVMAAAFMEKAGDYIAPKTKAQEVLGGKYTDESGRVHEPVAPEGA